MSRRTSHVEGVVMENQVFDELFNSRDRDIQYSDNAYNQVEFSLSNYEGFTQTMTTPVNDNVSPCVSLQDVQLNSEPASTTLTNLTTPGSDPLDSPFTHSTDTSPIFTADSYLPADSDKWGSLFETGNDFTIDIHEPFPLDDPVPDVPLARRMSRNASSPGQSSTRSSNQGRHSLTSGVSSRRRDKPLPAIIIDDPTDSVKVKRARNTLAARKSRQKRVKIHDELEAEVEDMKSQRDYWKLRAIELGHQE